MYNFVWFSTLMVDGPEKWIWRLFIYGPEKTEFRVMLNDCPKNCNIVES